MKEIRFFILKQLGLGCVGGNNLIEIRWSENVVCRMKSQTCKEPARAWNLLGLGNSMVKSLCFSEIERKPLWLKSDGK